MERAEAEVIWIAERATTDALERINGFDDIEERDLRRQASEGEPAVRPALRRDETRNNQVAEDFGEVPLRHFRARCDGFARLTRPGWGGGEHRHRS